MEPGNNSSNVSNSADLRRREIKRLKPSVGEEKALDRISGLPDPLLLQILSSLQAIDAVDASVLSKRWRGLWASNPILKFDYSYIVEIFHNYLGIKGLRLFVSFINRAMILYRSPKIEEFHVQMDYMKSFSSDVDVWLQMATRKNVEVIDLSFAKFDANDYLDASEEDADETSFYVIPRYVLNNSSLVKLTLCHCVIKHPGPISWISLKVLSFLFMSLSNDLIRDILSASPLLEVLKLCCCSHYNFIDIKSKRLRKLDIHERIHKNHSDLGNINALRISAPNVRSMDISGGVHTLKLKLSHCIIKHPGPNNWISLNVLSFFFMPLSNDLIRDILSASPLLEVLKLRYCSHYDFIDITSKRLRKLVIFHHNLENHSDLGNINALRISAPNVQSLYISGGVHTLKFSLINSLSVVDANINFTMPSDQPHFEGFCKEYPKIVKELLGKLCHVKYLQVGSFCLQALSLLEDRHLPCPLSNLVGLRIGTKLNEWELPGITRFLALTPLLETLVIDMACVSYSGLAFGPKVLESLDIDQENYWSSQKDHLALMLLNLKTVKIVNFKGSEKEIEVILFMLKNARRLEKMILQRRKLECAQLEESLLLTERILSFPRCSPGAVILFAEFIEDA